MRAKINTISQTINKNNPAINLPHTTIHDAYIMSFDMILENTSGEAITPTMDNLLKSIEQFVITSDGTNVHASLNGIDLARRDAMKSHAGCDRVIDRVLAAIADGATQEVKFKLFFDEGDILGPAHDSLEMKITFLNEVLNTAGLGIKSATVRVSIVELIPEGAELVARYGQSLELLAEPKVYVINQACPANSEFTGFMDLPTGTLQRGAMMYFSVAPEQVGVLKMVPDRTELLKVDFDVLRMIDERKFGCAVPDGIVTLDYGHQISCNNIGLLGWNWSKGDVQIAAKSANATTLRYVSYEHVVNTAIVEKAIGSLNIESAFGI